MLRLAKVARPWALVDAVTAPPSVPPAGPISSAVIARPASATLFPLTSWTWILGCCVNGIPLAAVDDGCLVITSLPADPTVAVAGKTTGEPVSPAEVAVADCAPATGPRV